MNIKGHKNLTIQHEKSFDDLPTWFQKAKTEWARVQMIDGKLVWFGGAWLNGTWHNGTWHTGTWFNGTWLNGTWFNGEWENGLWINGTWFNGEWENGLWITGKISLATTEWATCLGFDQNGERILEQC